MIKLIRLNLKIKYVENATYLLLKIKTMTYLNVFIFNLMIYRILPNVMKKFEDY